MPQDAQSAGMGQPAGMGNVGDSGAGNAGSGPGGGIGPPIGSPDPLSKYKWWILAILTLSLALVSGVFLRRKDQAATVAVSASDHLSSNSDLTEPFSRAGLRSSKPAASPVVSAGNSNDAILHLLKDEMFAIEREKLSGTLPSEEYAAVKVGLEALLRRVLMAQQPIDETRKVSSDS